MSVKKFSVLVPAMTLLLAFLQPLPVQAANSALWELIEILKNKGSITEEEYSLLKKAAEEESSSAPAVAANPAPQTVAPATAKPASEAVAKAAPAGWADSLELKGDIRLRYQNEREKPGTGRDRGRIRYRIGATAKPSEGWEVGGGLASGPTDPRSTNQSFSASFSKKPINLDYAYAQYQLNDELKLIGGKFRMAGYLATVDDLLWDTDVNPEGVSAAYNYKSSLGTTFANSGLWIMEEKQLTNQDAYMAYLQLGHSISGDTLFGSLAGTWYSIEDNDPPNNFPAGVGSNTDSEFSGVYTLAGELGIQNLIAEGTRFSLVGDVVENSDTGSAEDSGYLIGFKGAYRLWTFRYNYARLDQNVWPDFLPDADRYEGRTGVHGHEFLLEYAMMKNVMVAMNYYMSERNDNDTDHNLLQLDLNVKF